MIARLSAPEVLIGRALAMSLHPYAAWRTTSRARRALLLAVYATASYVIVLGVMLAL